MIKRILFLALFILIPVKSEAFYFSFGFGNGKEDVKAKEPCGACDKIAVVENKTPCNAPKIAKKSPPVSKPKLDKAKTATTQEKTKTAPPKPEYLAKAEKLVKVKKPHKRDWTTLTADSIGAAGITYGARKSNWFIGSGGAVVLLYSLIAERNTNSFLDQVVAVGSGVGLGYLPKINKDDSKNQTSSVTPLPPPPTP